MKNQHRIIAKFTGDHTGFFKEFDCTDQILKLNEREINSLEDYEYTSDSLASEELIDSAREEFRDQWGAGLKNTTFGYGVEVVQSILDYFKVEKLSDIKK